MVRVVRTVILELPLPLLVLSLAPSNMSLNQRIIIIKDGGQ